MNSPVSLLAVLVIAALALSACGGVSTTHPAPSRSVTSSADATAAVPTPAPRVTPDPVISAGSREDYIEAICPIFLTILVLDPRLADLRAAGTDGGNILSHATEIDSVAAELRTVINDLDGVPHWTPGSQLRTQLVLALHEMRSALLLVAQGLDHRDAAERLAGVPYIARPTVDEGMARAASAGLDCSGFE